MTNTKITFIIHGKIKSISSLKSEIESSFSKGYDVRFKVTDKISGAKNGVKEAIEEKTDIIIICGGDGSINETVNQLLASDNTRHIQCGVLPMGTGNDFAKSLEVKNNLKELKALIEQKKVINVSIFNMTFLDQNQKASSRYFVNIADIGIGGFAAEKVNSSSKLLGATFTYFKAIISSFLKFKKQPIHLTSDSFEWEGQVMSLCMANGKYFASGMCIAPDANICDQQLQLIILGNVSILDYLKNINRVKKGQKIDHKEVLYAAVNGCKIISKGMPCPIDMDGEFIGYTPLEVELSERKVSFYGRVL
jgi:diacylglycerol kinase (ATP)